MDILYILIVGALAGWLGSLIYQGAGLGCIGNIVIGLIGSFVGYWLLGKLDISAGSGTLGTILTGAIGAIVILFFINLVSGRR